MFEGEVLELLRGHSAPGMSRGLESISFPPVLPAELGRALQVNWAEYCPKGPISLTYRVHPRGEFNTLCKRRELLRTLTDRDPLTSMSVKLPRRHHNHRNDPIYGTSQHFPPGMAIYKPVHSFAFISWLSIS